MRFCCLNASNERTNKSSGSQSGRYRPPGGGGRIWGGGEEEGGGRGRQGGMETGVAEEELISIQNDIELRPKFKKSYQDFWLQK